jgi:hypothetical protein
LATAFCEKIGSPQVPPVHELWLTSLRYRQGWQRHWSQRSSYSAIANSRSTVTMWSFGKCSETYNKIGAAGYHLTFVVKWLNGVILSESNLSRPLCICNSKLVWAQCPPPRTISTSVVKYIRWRFFVPLTLEKTRDQVCCPSRDCTASSYY